VDTMTDHPPMAQAVVVDETAYIPTVSATSVPVATGATVLPGSSGGSTTIVPPAGSTATTSTTIVPPPTAATPSTTTTTYTVPPPSTTNNPGAPPGGKVHLSGLTMNPARITCPHCQNEGVTNIKSLIDCCTIVTFVILIFVFWPLCWLPFVMPCCKSTEHYCSRCHRRVGTVDPCNC